MVDHTLNHGILLPKFHQLQDQKPALPDGLIAFGELLRQQLIRYHEKKKRKGKGREGSHNVSIKQDKSHFSVKLFGILFHQY